MSLLLRHTPRERDLDPTSAFSNREITVWLYLSPATPHHLERHLTVVPGVLGETDGRRSTAAQLALEGVAVGERGGA
jgi:hypothetical protein